MKKLIRQLIKISNSVIESSSTYSTYYHIENVIVRVSDHVSNTIDKYDLQIINPLNGGTKYMVFSPKSSSSFLWNSDEIINYISFLTLQKKLETVNIKHKSITTVTDEKEEIALIPLIKVNIEGTTKKERAILCRNKNPWTESEMEECEKLLSRTYYKDTPVSFNDDFKLFLMTTPCSFKQVLNIYNTIVRFNKKEITIELATKVFNELDKI